MSVRLGSKISHICSFIASFYVLEKQQWKLQFQNTCIQESQVKLIATQSLSIIITTKDAIEWNFVNHTAKKLKWFHRVMITSSLILKCTIQQPSPKILTSTGSKYGINMQNDSRFEALRTFTNTAAFRAKEGRRREKRPASAIVVRFNTVRMLKALRFFTIEIN